MQYLLLFSPFSNNKPKQFFPFPSQLPPPPKALSLSPSLQLTGAHTHTHTFATVVAVFITSVIGSAGCPQTLLSMRWCGSHQRKLSSSHHRVSQQPSPEKIVADELQEMLILKTERKTEKKDWMPGPKSRRNWQGTRLSRGQPHGWTLPWHMVFARLSDLSTPDMAATSWKEKHVVVDVCFDETRATRASNVKVGARPTVVRNRVHATACWYAGLLGACRRYNGSPSTCAILKRPRWSSKNQTRSRPQSGRHRRSMHTNWHERSRKINLKFLY